MAWKFLMINLYTIHTSPKAYMLALVTSSTLVIQMRELIKVRLRYTNAVQVTDTQIYINTITYTGI